MKKHNYLIIIVGLLIFAGGLTGRMINSYSFMKNADEVQNNSYRMNQVDFGMNNLSRPMSFSFNNQISDDDLVKLTLEELKHDVNEYIDYYGEGLEISDIFIFEDSEYYFSIVEEETGRGAMELLANQYTGDVYPEFGPNMMWNLKYGMHNTGGMMGRRGFNYEYNTSNNYKNNEITDEEAYNYGNSYLNKNESGLKLSHDFHEFYGYFTFHVDKDDKTVGMLSVNGFTGEVWYHEWHGNLVEVIEGNAGH